MASRIQRIQQYRAAGSDDSGIGAPYGNRKVAVVL